MKTVAPFLALMLAILGCFMPTAGAEEKDRGKRPERSPRWSEEAFNPRSEEGRAMIEKIMRTRLRKELKLTEEQAEKIAVRFRTLREEMAALRRERFGLYKALEAMAEETPGEAPEEDTLPELLDRVDALDDAMREMRRKAYDEAAEPLAPWQRARLYIFMARFEMDMRRLIERAKRKAEETRGEKDNHGATEPQR